MAMLVTHLSAATATIVWMAIEWIRFGKPSLVGAVTGTIAGLAAITPAAGVVGPLAAVLLGAMAGGICFAAVLLVKQVIQVDDALDVLGVHGVGGALGALLTGVFAKNAINALGKGWIYDGNGHQLLIQLYSVLATFLYCGIATFIILKLIDLTIGLRVSREVEIEGLDINLHGETVHS